MSMPWSELPKWTSNKKLKDTASKLADTDPPKNQSLLPKSSPQTMCTTKDSPASTTSASKAPPFSSAGTTSGKQILRMTGLQKSSSMTKAAPTHNLPALTMTVNSLWNPIQEQLSPRLLTSKPTCTSPPISSSPTHPPCYLYSQSIARAIWARKSPTNFSVL